MSHLRNNLLSILLLICVAFVFRTQLEYAWDSAQQRYFPCSSPIVYRIDMFDERFGISREEFLAAASEAETVWEDAANTELFVYEEAGRLALNLKYDNRQDATVRLQKTESVLDSTRVEYSELKARYDSIKSEHAKLKHQFDIQVAAYTARQSTYNTQIDQYNSQGGASAEEYARMEAERAALNSESEALKKIQDRVNAKVDELNRASVELNSQVAEVNQHVKKYNTISTENGDEYQEGVYHSDSDGDRIDIYQYDSHDTLVRLLVHEFGHALGLGHVANPDAIMYAYNDSKNLKLTADDRAELSRVCTQSLVA